MQTYALFDNGTAELITIKLLNVEVKDTLDIYFQSFRSPKVKESAKRGIECAYEAIFSKDINAHLQKTPISVTVKDFSQQVDGSSAGIAYAIAFALALVKDNIIVAPVDLPDEVAATGEVDNNGNIKAIRNIREKIIGAIGQNAGIMFYPSENSRELKALLEKDEELNQAVKDSGIKLKAVDSIKHLFCEIDILPKSLNEIKHVYKKVFLALILVVTLFVSGIMIYPKLLPSDVKVSGNLALNKMAYASSNETSYIASMAFDGKSDTRWSSECSDVQSIFLDLGKSHSISCVVLKWEEAYAKQYQIQVSKDGETWSTVYTNNLNKGGVNVINFKPTDARFVKMYAWERATVFGYSLWEFEVYSSKRTIEESSSSASKSNEYAFVKINKPFPQNLNYEGCIKPNNVTQDQMNSSIKSYYDSWKAEYVKESNGTTPGGGYYVEFKLMAEGLHRKTMSSVHGYGMIIFALMAGYDGEAKQYFDGMYNMYNNHRSKENHNLMSWIIDEEEYISNVSDSSTTGDLEIAYALLLAHSQWGSEGKINYLYEAKRIITNGIKKNEISNSTMKTLLGDWSKDQNKTRVNDWMTDHFQAYYDATGDSFWEDTRNVTYSLISQISSEYSPDTGLMPNFLEKNPSRPSDNGEYGEDSCTLPWKLATDYALYGNGKPKEACSKILAWLKNATDNNPSNIKAGYKIDGNPISSNSSILFTSPFITACIVDGSHQDYLNKGWSEISKLKEFSEADSVNLLCMILISGNWWAPAFK